MEHAFYLSLIPIPEHTIIEKGKPCSREIFHNITISRILGDILDQRRIRPGG
jgi:hypothetical protein